jgi:predicted AAA+ superfamily ATPase
MVIRTHWINLLENALKSRSIVWLSGVRRVGKTCLCQSLENVSYYDCELPRTRQMLVDPEGFLEEHAGQRLILDEIHRLENPSELLKIAADHFKGTQIIATGSSTLSASSKFKDTLAGRKRDIWLTPMTHRDIEAFGNQGWDHRFLRGGLPAFFCDDDYPEKDYQEWLDAFWAKDIQELYRLEKRDSFMRFFELLMQQSGGIFEATSLASPCNASRTTLQNYLRVLEDTYAITVLRPFFSNKSKEITSAPKVYGFDTGFVAFNKGWTALRPEDRGLMWEHVVLNELLASGQRDRLRYWRTKQKQEVDFVLVRRGQPPVAIECKWKHNTDKDCDLLVKFAESYPDAQLVLVAQNIPEPYRRKYKSVDVQFLRLEDLERIY